MRNKEIDRARLFIYNLLSLLFVESHVKSEMSKIKESLELLSINSFDDDVSEAAKTILQNIESSSNEELYNEYQELFLVPFGKFISLSASYYYEQREGGAMLLRVRNLLAKTKIRKDEAVFSAPEDHFGFIFTFTSYLIEQELQGELDEDLQKELFEAVINPFCDEIVHRMISSGTKLYSHVGAILGNFCNFERVYLDIAKIKAA
ncbi:TorD-family protein [Sulfurimonas denitrificans DSM 1251]|uniref:TorD-family protein n=1 Tax=Sulfurimonas denitrificans (strain ATCC 33889 / DSM 1251) TaxID=326298 RepID=Q30SC9_SULDN|nr:molecular chaperone TorD family protein [Sulfurimonas denitrificans]ABB44102.1 TorD-family protein [Sulfurimonas denitrificans DSM 1251]MDD3441891.1 molecular chaperone TorD family protein [Sulfurimonas denitrificans]